MQCAWVIMPTAGASLRVTFTAINVRGMFEGTCFSSSAWTWHPPCLLLQVRCTSSTCLRCRFRLRPTLTGNLTDPLPGPFRVVPPNPTGNLIIKFYTDLSGTETGFSLVYQSIPIPPVVGTPSTSPSPVASADSDGTPMSLVVGLAVGLSAAGVAMAGAGLLVWRCRRAGGWLLLAGRGCPMSRLHSHITASPSVVCSCFLWMGLT